KPAYLIHGDDHGAIAERRAGLRALAEREGAPDSVEALEGESATPAGGAAGLAARAPAVGGGGGPGGARGSRCGDDAWDRVGGVPRGWGRSLEAGRGRATPGARSPGHASRHDA